MTRYKYVAIALITLLAGYYCSCQCNNPTLIEPENYQPENPQSGDPTPSTELGVGKHQGIQRNEGWNTCYMNSTLQVLFALYGDVVKSKCQGAGENSMCGKMLKLFNKVTKVDKNPITDEEIENFYYSMKYEDLKYEDSDGKYFQGKFWSIPIDSQEDASEFLGRFWKWLSLNTIGIDDASEGLIVESVFTLPFGTGSHSIQTLIDKNTIHGVAGLHKDIFVIRLERNNSGDKNEADVQSPLNITIKKDKADLTKDTKYHLFSFINHSGE